MMLTGSTVLRSQKGLVRSASRALSTAPVKPPDAPKKKTPEQLAEYQARQLKFNQKRAGMPDLVGLGTGSDLHVPKNIAELAVFNGMPAEHQKRTVLIAQRPQRTVQSGFSNTHQWALKWKSMEKWSNPLMGWSSSADPMGSVELHFNSKEDAIAFADRNGWKYEVLLPGSRRSAPVAFNSYKDNFLDKRTQLVLKKEGNKCKNFLNPAYGKSHWFMPLKFHGDGEVRQHGPSVAADAKA